MNELSGKVVVVTGSTQGVGEAVALACARAGARGVVVCGRNESRGRAVEQQLIELGAEALYVPCDLGEEADCRRVIAECDAKFGAVDGLVNAAADTNRGTVESTTVELWERQFRINVRAPFLLVQEAVRVMRREGNGGSIVNVLSVAAYCGMDNLVSYSATKGALATLTKNLANGLRRDRIRVNGIKLGWTNTPNEHVVQKLQGSGDDWLERAERESPFGRLIRPDDVAELCLFLLSERSGIVTGSNIDYAQRVMGAIPPGN
ncbi:MAG: SDR family oxidoreductase [Planctomycetales bacterium]|nr:SDR family oxidoreductase [Planctomycetales bacterium]